MWYLDYMIVTHLKNDVTWMKFNTLCAIYNTSRTDLCLFVAGVESSFNTSGGSSKFLDVVKESDDEDASTSRIYARFTQG